MKLVDFKDEIKEKVNIDSENIKQKINIGKETLEAKLAGQAALNSLYRAKEHLNSAKNWGIFDLFGGGFISSIAKHSKMNDARSYIKQAKLNLEKFAKELNDVEILCDINVDTEDFLGFADIFFDNVLSDFMMQDRINKARNQIDEAIYRVEEIMSKL